MVSLKSYSTQYTLAYYILLYHNSSTSEIAWQDLESSYIALLIVIIFTRSFHLFLKTLAPKVI